MCWMMAIPIALGAAAAAKSFAGSEQQRAGQEYQADVAGNNALAMRRQAVVDRQKGEIAKSAIDHDRDLLHRNYDTQAAGNRALLAGGNVDMTSGSAADTLTGNATIFASDMATNRYNREVAGWEANEKAKQSEFAAAQYDSQATWLKKTAGNVGMSLLTAGIAGAGTFMAAYGAMGLGSAPTTGFDRALGQYVSKTPLH